MNSYNRVSVSDAQRLRRKRRNRIVVIAFFCLLAIVIILESPLTRVRRVTVSGNTSIPSSRLLKEIAIHKGDSLWQVNPAAVRASITSREPLVQGVQVHTNFLQGTVQVQIVQKKVAAILQSNGKFYNLLSDGTVYNVLSSSSGFALPVITTAHAVSVTVGKPTTDSGVTILCRELSKLQAVQTQHISQIQLDGLGSATLYMDNGYEVVLSVDNLDKQLSNVQSVVAYFLKKGYAPGLIDMSGQPPYQYTPFKTGKGS